MFINRGKTRTLQHNLQIASLLSFVAGAVNIVGFELTERLTTNVTGHFAYLIDQVLGLQFFQAFVYFIYIFCFFLGSMTSSFLVEFMSLRSERFMFIVPVIIEIIILSAIGILAYYNDFHTRDIIAFSLLFAMGLQNSLVTSLSSAVVRTTHLTGLFTDLGIEISQLFYYKTVEQKLKLQSSIKLRLTIISFFFLGGMVGGLAYTRINALVLVLAAIMLIFGLIYDNLKFRILLIRRRLSAE